MNILAELPAVATRHVLVEWLDIVEIARLDEALGASLRASPLRSVIWSNRSAYRSQRSTCTNTMNAPAFVRWMQKRNIAVRSLLSKDRCAHSLVAELLNTTLNGAATAEYSNLREFCVVTSYDADTIASNRLYYAMPPPRPPRYLDAGISALAPRCAGLVRVRLAQLDVSDIAVRVICECCPNLEYLDISGCTAVTGAYARYHLLKRLRHLDLSHTHCTAAVMRSVVLCDSLRNLKLGHAINDEAMQPLITGCPNLTDFALPKWTGEGSRTSLSADTQKNFLQHHTHLRSFIFPHQPLEANVAATIALTLAQCCQNLEEVDFTNNRRISDSDVIGLAQACRQLKRLGLANTDIRDGALTALGTYCPLLEMLIFESCCNVTDVGVIALAKGCPCLQHFDAGDCLQLTSRCPTALAQFCSDLRVARFSGCNRILLPTVQKIFQRWVCPKLSVEFLKSDERKVVHDHTIAAALLNHA